MVCEAGSGQPGALALRPLHVFGCEVLHTVQANLQVAFYNHFPNAGHWLMSFATVRRPRCASAARRSLRGR